jgi:hypothetical protein
MLNLIPALYARYGRQRDLLRHHVVFRKARQFRQKSFFYGKAPDKLAIESLALRRNRRFVVWFIAALAFLIITIVISGRLPIVPRYGTEPGPKQPLFRPQRCLLRRHPASYPNSRSHCKINSLPPSIEEAFNG